jgi:hypothetical protein
VSAIERGDQFGAELNAERERLRQLEAGTPGAERELQLDERSEPKAKRRTRPLIDRTDPSTT